MYYALLNNANICIGISNLSGEVNSPNLVAINSHDEDFLWRKYENGQWSAEKFEPPVPVPEPSLQEQVVTLDERTVGMQAIDDYTLQQTITMDDRTEGMQAIDDFTLELVNQQAELIAQLQADVAALKGGA